MSSTTENASSPQTTPSQPQSDRLTGQVKWFNTKAGYGFITGCNGDYANQDIFIHYSSIKVTNSQYRYLVQGEYVEFDVVKTEGDKHEHHAVNVSGLNMGPIMCEARRTATLSRGGESSRPRPSGRRLRVNRREYEDREREPRQETGGDRERVERQDRQDRVERSERRPRSSNDEGFTYVRKRRDERQERSGGSGSGGDRDRDRSDDRRRSRPAASGSGGRTVRKD